jgi:hypothetical protein
VAVTVTSLWYYNRTTGSDSEPSLGPMPLPVQSILKPPVTQNQTSESPENESSPDQTVALAPPTKQDEKRNNVETPWNNNSDHKQHSRDTEQEWK